LGPIVTACADPTSPTCVGTIQAQLQQTATNYQTILSRLRAAAGPDTVIAVMTYYNPLRLHRLVWVSAITKFPRLEGLAIT
jgi:hypothetical protein